MQNYQKEPWTALKRIFRYVQCIKSHGLHFHPRYKIYFREYSDADWYGDHADCKSTSGYAFMLMGTPISRGSKVSQVYHYQRVKRGTLR